MKQKKALSQKLYKKNYFKNCIILKHNCTDKWMDRQTEEHIDEGKTRAQFSKFTRMTAFISSEAF